MKIPKTKRNIIKILKAEEKQILINQSGHWQIDLTEENASVTIKGLIYGRENSKLEIKITVNHLAPSTKSNILIKSILAKNCRMEFTGLVRINKNAKNSQTKQICRNLLLGPAKIIMNPCFEILNKEVNCMHAVATGKIDDGQLFYLKSRGIPEIGAKKLLIDGFLK